VSIAAASVIGAQLATRIGTKVVVTSGMVLFGIAFAWISTTTVDASYASAIVPQMVLIGTGMGLISTPATESILRVLPPARAGVGSAVNDATRELGGTLGVAIVGSVFSSVFASRLSEGAFGRLPAASQEQAASSVNIAAAIAARSPQLTHALQNAFVSGLHTSCLTLAAICLVGSVAAAIALPGRRTRGSDVDMAWMAQTPDLSVTAIPAGRSS
jgi:MFS family permease